MRYARHSALWPGTVLWMEAFEPGSFTSSVWDNNLSEGWFMPPDFYDFPGDHVCWHYKFPVPVERGCGLGQW